MIRILAITLLGLSGLSAAQSPTIAPDGLVHAGDHSGLLAGVQPPQSDSERERWQQLFDLVPWSAQSTDDGLHLRWREHNASKLLIAAGLAIPTDGSSAPLADHLSLQSQPILSLRIDGLTYPPVHTLRYDLANLMIHIGTSYGLACQSQGALPQYPVATIIGIADGSFLLLANRGPGSSLIDYRLEQNIVELFTPHGDNICGTPTALRVTLEAPAETYVGDNVTFVLRAFNDTTATLNAPQISIDLPAGIALSTAAGNGWSCSPVASDLECSRSSLPAGASHRIDLTLTPTALGTAALSCSASMASAGNINDAGCSAETAVIENLDHLFGDRFKALALALSRWSY